MTRRLALATLVAAAMGSLVATHAFAQAFPSKPLRIFVAFPPGGPADTTARVLAQHMSAGLGQPVIVENRGGATGTIAASAVVKSPPDGYTLLFTSSSGYTTGPLLMEKPPFDPARDMIPVSMVLEYPIIFVANPVLPASNVREFVALMKEKPGAMSFGSPGNGSIGNLMGERFKRATGTDAVHVPYKGSAPAVADVVAGRLAFAMDSIQATAGFIRAGKLKALAVSTRERTPLLPEVPTFAEAGVEGMEEKMWFGVFAPAATPAPIVDQLAAQVSRAVKEPEVRTFMAQQATLPVGSTSAEFQAVIAEELKRWGATIRTYGIKLE